MDIVFNHSSPATNRGTKMSRQMVILVLFVLVAAQSVTARVADLNHDQDGKVAIECEEGHLACVDVCCDVGEVCCHARWCDRPGTCNPFV